MVSLDLNIGSYVSLLVDADKIIHFAEGFYPLDETKRTGLMEMLEKRIGETMRKDFAKNTDVSFNVEQKLKKTAKIIAVLEEEGALKKTRVLDVGCAVGVMTNILRKHFKEVIGIDNDKYAIKKAKEMHGEGFQYMDAEKMTFQDNSFDIIICSHTYEHVDNHQKLMDEIFRVLKQGGICYFAAGNKYRLIEGHYKLPFLSWFPKKISVLYLKLFRFNKQVKRLGTDYPENHLSLFGLRKITSKFHVIDYTKNIVFDPERFKATDMMKAGSVKHLLMIILVMPFYFLCPTYIWILTKQ